MVGLCPSSVVNPEFHVSKKAPLHRKFTCKINLFGYFFKLLSGFLFKIFLFYLYFIFSMPILKF